MTFTTTPDGFAQNAPDVGASFEQAQNAQRAEEQARAERREAFMVARDRPEPVLRPEPSLAAGVDAQSFNQRWEAEREAAAQANINQAQAQTPDAEHSPNERVREAFKLARRKQEEDQALERERRDKENDFDR
ncbi:MAG: hypothetical protein AAFP79_12260 [Pseudomonadota bacterium]